MLGPFLWSPGVENIMKQRMKREGPFCKSHRAIASQGKKLVATSDEHVATSDSYRG